MLWVMGVYFLLSILGYGSSNPQVVKKKKKWCKVFIREKVLITNSPKIEPGRNQSGKLGKELLTQSGIACESDQMLPSRWDLCDTYSLLLRR